MGQYLTNAWYMAAWADDISEALLTRRMLDSAVLLTRSTDGTAVAMQDRCPHRFAPLSKGDRRGDTVVCGYHGLTFDLAGQCVANPFSDRLPTGAQVRSYPLVEQDGILWLWPGDPAAADSTTIPRFPFIPDTDHSRTVHGYTLMRAGYEYGTDNLMDLSHIEFVHRGSFAGGGVIFAGKHDVQQEADTLRSSWWMPNIPPPSMATGFFPPEARVDHWLDMRWNAPASMFLEIGVVPTGAPREAGFALPQAHILTPATEHETHYFWSSTRYHDLNSPTTDAALRQLFGQAFDEEDKPMIEAAYANISGDFWDQKPLSLGIDTGGTRARRMLQSMIRKEAETMAQP